MDLPRKINALAIACMIMTILPAVQAAECSRVDHKSVRANTMDCESRVIKVACEHDFQDVVSGAALCCPLEANQRVSWFCDGERKRLRCPLGSVSVEATATDSGVKLTCFEPKLEPAPAIEEIFEDEEPAES